MTRIPAAALAMALLGIYTNAQADAGGPPAQTADPWLRVNNGSDLLGSNSQPNPDHSFSYDSSWTLPGEYSISWDLKVNPDPFLDGSITITNLSSAAKDFAVNLGLPVSPAFSPSHFGGSIGLQLTDLNGNGNAAIQPTLALGEPIFQGKIDGSTVLQLMAALISCSGPNCTASSAEDDGLPGLTLLGPAVNTSIGTLIKFNLSGGDRVSLTTHFEVAPVPVPLPATLPLLALAMGFGMSTMRKKK